MGLFGKILGTAFDVVTAPIAIAKDLIPGGEGYVDGNPSKTGEKMDELGEDIRKLRKEVEEL